MGKEEKPRWCACAHGPSQLWSVVELGSHVLGKAQPHLSTYGPRITTKSPRAHSSTLFQRLNVLDACGRPMERSLCAPWPSSAQHKSLSLVPGGDAR